MNLKNNIKILKFHINLKFQQLKGYIGRDGEPKKCPYCKSKELETYETFRHDQGFVEEYWVRCKKCKQRVAVWSYGDWYYEED